MKISKNKLFNYPVLNHLRGDYKKESDFNTVVKVKQYSSYIEFEVAFLLIDNKLTEFIKEEIVIQVVHIECSKTKFRKIYLIDKDEFTIKIKIDAKLLNGNVEILPMIISAKDFIYKNMLFNDDYGELSFALRKGMIIAYDDTSYTYIEKDKKDYVGVPSVIIVTKHSGDDETMKIDVETGSKIIVDLHELDYESYHALVGSDVNAQISHQLIIFPAVIKALEAMGDEEFRSEIEHRKWFLTFKKQLDQMKVDIENPEFIRNKYLLAQKLLNNPVNRAFNNLLTLQED